MIDNLLFNLFLWLGKRWFSCVSIYNPTGGDDEFVKVIHFAASERDLNNSVRDYLQDLDGKQQSEDA